MPSANAWPKPSDVLASAAASAAAPTWPLPKPYCPAAKISAADDHQNEAKREGQPGEQANNAIGQKLGGAGGCDGSEHGAEADKGAAQGGQGKEAHGIETGLGLADLLRLERHLLRHEIIDLRGVRLRAVLQGVFFILRIRAQCLVAPLNCQV